MFGVYLIPEYVMYRAFDSDEPIAQVGTSIEIFTGHIHRLGWRGMADMCYLQAVGADAPLTWMSSLAYAWYE